MIKIQNIYYMLAYAYQVLNENGYKNLSLESFDNALDLLSAILAKGLSFQIKKGLSSEYIKNTDALTAVRGKIAASQTAGQYYMNRKIVCDYDEFSANIQLNQILKSTALLLLKSGDILPETKRSLRKSLVFFSGIDTIPVSGIKWNSIRYNHGNASYRMLMSICRMIAEGLLVSEKDGTVKFTDMDEKHRHRLYERFILEYYRRHFPFLHPASRVIKWNVDNDFSDFLPDMRTDVTLTYGDYTLIIDAKYYQKSMQRGVYGGKQTIHSGHLYQIYAYVKNKDTRKDGSVSGMLLYAKTDEEICVDFPYKIDGSDITVKNLDLNTDFPDIARSLDEIVYSWQSELRGTRKN